ncbi:hypothetical protein [Frateuria defendens]|uniref:hypothetical protein n=1 Tax=Frateuria defendens TaxID=2219559 RepID=UPI00066FC27E|nr:hypothetical protein [Frateuria defendens]
MSQRSRYYLSIDDLAHARGREPRLAYDGAGPGDFAAALQAALCDPALFERWRALQDDPEAVDMSLGAIDPDAEAKAEVSDLRTRVELTTSLPMRIVRHRLDLLIGANWLLRDLRSA